MVNVLDKREVVDYLTGISDQCTQVDASVRPQTLVKKSDIRSGKTVQA